MKKVLILLLTMLLSLSALSAQTEGMDFNEIMEMLQDDTVFLETDLSDFASEITPELKATIEETLIEANIDTDVITTTLAVVDGIGDGTYTNLQDVEDDSTIDFDVVKDSIIESVATMAVDQLLAEDNADAEDLRSSVKMLSGALQTLSEFGQANAQTSTASSLFGYQGYDLFAVSFGILGSVATDMDTVDTIIEMISSDDMSTQLEDQLNAGGLAFGVAMQGFSGNVGLNMNWLAEDLYLGVVFGSLSVGITPENGLNASLLGSSVYSDPKMTFAQLSGADSLDMSVDLNTSTFGITANYQLIKPASIPILFRWNGISIGTGIIYNSFDIHAEADLGSLMPAEEGSTTTIEPGMFKGKFEITSSSYTIPLEASTGIRLLSMLNISLGVAADLKFGTSNVGFDLETQNPDSMGSKLLVTVFDQVLQEENVSFPYTGAGEIQLFNPRVMVGVGVGLGPATVDITGTVYASPQNKVGFTIGTSVILRI